MTDFQMDSSGSEATDSETEELQQALAKGLLKPGLNTVEKPPKQYVNNIPGLRQKLTEFQTDLPWIELLDCTNKEAPLAPELAAQMLSHEQRRENELKNNKKLRQFEPSSDPVLIDFKRETLFHRQAQAAVVEALPKLKALGLATIRPEDYFAEMAKTDGHMQKVRENLMKKQSQKQQSEKIKQLRLQRKAGKALQVEAKLHRQKEKKDMLEQVKKVRKGVSKNMDFLEGNKKNGMRSKKAEEKKRLKDKRFGFGGKKKGSKLNTKESALDVSEYKRPRPPKKGIKGKKMGGKGGKSSNRPGKNRRAKNKSKGKK